MALDARVRSYGGRPTLFINGSPHTGMMWYGRPNTAGDFADAGVHLCEFALTATEPWWIGPERYDFQSVDRLIDEHVRADPDALLMPRIHLGYGDMAWWAQQHPEELAAGCESGGRTVDYFRAAKNDVGCPFSFFSRKFIADASKALTALVRHLEARDGGERVFGYHLAGGISAEWFAWWTYIEGCTEDYSPACTRAFRTWLRRKYAASTQKLRAAWGDRKLRFDNVAVPSPQALNGPLNGDLRDALRERPAIDFYTFFSEQTVATINVLCRALKRASGGRKLVGVFYGYMWPHWNNLNPARQGHAALAALRLSRLIDFIVAPYHYDHRGMDGVHGSQTLVDAIHAAGKLHLDEIDTFTHLTKWPFKSLKTVRHAQTPVESQRILRRDAGFVLAKGGASWWMDLLHQRWHGDPAVIDVIAQARRAAEWLIAWPGPPAGASHVASTRDRRSVSHVAVVVDDTVGPYLRPMSDLPYHLLTAQRQFELSRIGAPFDELLLSDLLRRDLPDYSLLIFPNAFHIAPDMRRAIGRYVKRDGRIAVWVYAPGVFGDLRRAAPRHTRGLDLDAASELIGMPLRCDFRATRLQVHVGRAQHAVLGDLSGVGVYGMHMTRDRQRQTIVHPNPNGWKTHASPIFYVDGGADSDIDAIGLLAGTRRIGLAMRTFETWTSVYSAAPCLPAAVLRAFAKHAGVHLWTEFGDVVCANRSFVAVKSERGGEVPIHLPSDARTLSLSGHEIRQMGRELRVRMEPHDTVWIGLEAQAE